MKENSPFTPGSPVPLELFVGRVKEIEEILRYIRQSSSGRQENVFLSGERGIGKSSFADYLISLARGPKENFLAVHVFLGGATTLEELVRRVFEQIINTLNSQTWWNKISEGFKTITKYVNNIDVFGMAVGFNPPHQDLQDLVRHFPDALYNLTKKIKEQGKQGIFIVLDDINGLSKTADFANWYKSLVDLIPNTYQEFPVLIMPIGLPEIRDSLSEIQPSLMRIFRVVEINKLSDNDVGTFFSNAFNKANVKIEPKAMEIVIKYTSGLPIFMQEIGDSIFWADADNLVNMQDAVSGITRAAATIGKKYLDPNVYRAIRSQIYRSILRKLGEKIGKEKWETTSVFTRKEIDKILEDDEKKNIDNFLSKMQSLGIITPDLEGGAGAYVFTNQLYPIYIMIESIEYKRKIPGPLFEKHQ